MEDVQALEIERYLGKVRSRIDLIGVELEGGWGHGLFPKNERFEKDASVFHDRTIIQRAKVKSLRISHMGELPSQPMMPIAMPMWMKKCYPQMVDDTCGLHIHMSFHTKVHYSLLMIPEFQKTMIVYLKDWANEEKLPEKHPIWSRLNGANEYCNHEFYADLQVVEGKKDYDHFRKGNRYTAVAYRGGKTIECRILPMFETVDQSIRALKKVMDVTNACLVKVAEKCGPEILEVKDLPLGGILERDVERI